MTSKKNRPSWRVPLVVHRQQAEFRCTPSRFGDGHPNRRQCQAVARSTGQRCRKDAMQGATTCASHGGHRAAYQNAPAGFYASRRGISTVRMGLAELAATERYPPGVAWSASPVERGKRIEAARNWRLGLTVERSEKDL